LTWEISLAIGVDEAAPARCASALLTITADRKTISYAVGEDGLPEVGVQVKPKQVIAAYPDDIDHTKYVRYKQDKVAYIERV